MKNNLYLNQDRVRDVANFSKKLDAEDKKIKITLKDKNGKITTISDKQKNSITFKAKDCEELLFNWLC